MTGFFCVITGIRRSYFFFWIGLNFFSAVLRLRFNNLMRLILMGTFSK